MRKEAFWMAYFNLPEFEGHPEISVPGSGFMRHPILETQDSDGFWCPTEIGQDGELLCKLWKVSKTSIHNLNTVTTLQRTA